MSILSPLTAVVSAIVPMTWGLAQGAELRPIGYWALGIALVAVVLVGFVPEKGAVRPSLRGLLMAVASGTLIGAFLIIIDQTPDDSGLVPLVVNRLVNATTMFAAVGVVALLALRRRAGVPAEVGTSSSLVEAPPSLRGGGLETSLRATWLPGLSFAIACGVVDAVANTLLLLGLRLGELTVMSVLTAMYPAGTIILAAIVLRERIAPVQIVGLVLALAAAGMLALA